MDDGEDDDDAAILVLWWGSGRVRGRGGERTTGNLFQLSMRPCPAAVDHRVGGALRAAGRVVVAVTRRGAHTMYGFMYAEVLRARARMRACAGTEIHTLLPTSELRHEIVCNPSDRARVT